MNYELRTLCAEDMFPMFKIISAIGIREFKECFESEEVKKIASSAANGEDVDTSTVGMMIMVDVVGLVISKLPSCETEIYNFLNRISNVSIEEIKKMDMATFTQMIVDVIQKPEFKDFIGVVSKLFK